MSTITRMWLAFAAIGTGVIHFALVISSPLPIAIVLVLLGILECGWGVIAFLRNNTVASHAVLIGATAPIVLWGLVVVAATITGDSTIVSALGVLPLAVATVFELFIACVVAVRLRNKPDESIPASAPSAWRYLAGVMLGGVAVAMLTTPALAATEAGLYAQPHGGHSDTVVPEPREPAELGHEDPQHP